MIHKIKLGSCWKWNSGKNVFAIIVGYEYDNVKYKLINYAKYGVTNDDGYVYGLRDAHHFLKTFSPYCFIKARKAYIDDNSS